MKMVKDLPPNRLPHSGLLSSRNSSTPRSQQGRHPPVQMRRTPPKQNTFPNRGCRSVEDVKSPGRFECKKISSLPHRVQCRGKFHYEKPSPRLDSNRRCDDTEDLNLQDNFSGHQKPVSPLNKPSWKRRRRFRVRLIYDADARQEVGDEKAVNIQNIQLTGENRSSLKREEVVHYTTILNSVIQETIKQIKKRCLNDAQKNSTHELKNSEPQDDKNLADISEQLNQITGKVVARYASPKAKPKPNKPFAQFKPKMLSQSAQANIPIRRMRDSVTQFNVSCKNVKVSNQSLATTENESLQCDDAQETELIPKFTEFPLSSDPKIPLSDFVIRSKDPRHSEFLIDSAKKVFQSDPGMIRNRFANHPHETSRSSVLVGKSTVVSSHLAQCLTKMHGSIDTGNIQDDDGQAEFNESGDEDEIKATPKVAPFSESDEASGNAKENVSDYGMDYDPCEDEESEGFYLYNRNLDLFDRRVQKQIRQIHGIYELYKSEKKYMKSKGLKTIVYNANDMKVVQKILLRICIIMNMEEPRLYDLLEVKGEIISRAADSMLDWIEYMMRISYSKLRYIDRTHGFHPNYDLSQIENLIASACILIDSMKYCLVGGREDRQKHTSEKLKIREGLHISSQTRYGNIDEPSDSEIETSYEECGLEVGDTPGSTKKGRDLSSKRRKSKKLHKPLSKEKEKGKRSHSGESNCICECVQVWQNEFPCLDIRENENDFSILNEYGDNEVIFADRKNLLSYYNIGVGNDTSFEESSRKPKPDFFTREVEDLNDELNDALSDERYKVKFRKPQKKADFNLQKEGDINRIESDIDFERKKETFSAKPEDDLNYLTDDAVLDDIQEMQIEQKKVVRDEQSEEKYLNYLSNTAVGNTAKKAEKNQKKACIEAALNVLSEVDEKLAVLKTQQKSGKANKDAEVFQRPSGKASKGQKVFQRSSGTGNKGQKKFQGKRSHDSHLKSHMNANKDFQRLREKSSQDSQMRSHMYRKNFQREPQRSLHHSHIRSHMNTQTDFQGLSEKSSFDNHTRSRTNTPRDFKKPVKKASLQKQAREGQKGRMQSPNYDFLNVIAESQSDSENEVTKTSSSIITDISIEVEAKPEKIKPKKNCAPNRHDREDQKGYDMHDRDQKDYDMFNREDQKDHDMYNREDQKDHDMYNREDQKDYNMYNREDQKDYGMYDRDQKDYGMYDRDQKNYDMYNREDQKDYGMYNRDQKDYGMYDRDQKDYGMYDRDQKDYGMYDRDQKDYGMYDRDQKDYGMYDRDQKSLKPFKRIVSRGRGQRVEKMTHSKVPKPHANGPVYNRSSSGGKNGRVTEPTITYLQKMGPKEEVKQNIEAGARDFRHQWED